MDFELTEEQRQIRTTVADFAEREIKPNAGRWNREAIFPREIVEKSVNWVSSVLPFPSSMAAAVLTPCRR